MEDALDKQAKQMGRKMLAIYEETAPKLKKLTSEGVPTTCTKGCSHCCSLQIYISLPEAVAIAERMSQTPARLKQMVQKCEEHIGKQQLNQSAHFKQNLPCMFLTNNKECSIYDVRPMPCRHHYAVTPPESCAPNAEQESEVGRYDTSEVDREVMMTAVKEYRRANLPPLIAPIPVAVLWALRLLESGPVKFLSLLETQENLGLADIRMWTQISLMNNESTKESPEQPPEEVQEGV